MTMARGEIVVEGVEGFYHCISRCVRRAFLCGVDGYSGRSYEHRKDWVRDRLKHLAEFFAVEVCSYAVMSNHLHVVLRTRPDLVEAWPAEEIDWRWTRVFPGFKNGGIRREDEANKVPVSRAVTPERIAELRSRLGSVSWFMRCLNESIAREANKEDGCKGRFWEGRFKCQALLDESAVLTCMAYVDLNPIRAGLADRPEESEYTSVQDRIQGREMRRKDAPGLESAAIVKDKSTAPAGFLSPAFPDHWLSPFDDAPRIGENGILPLSTDEYLNLVDWAGRQIRQDKSGAIPDHLAPILVRLSIEPGQWADTVHWYGRRFHRAVGRAASMLDAGKRLGLRWLAGLKAGRMAFSETPA
jgi:putative transposase